MNMEEAVESTMKNKGIENLKAATMNTEEAAEALHSWCKGLIPVEDVKESME